MPRSPLPSLTSLPLSHSTQLPAHTLIRLRGEPENRLLPLEWQKKPPNSPGFEPLTSLCVSLKKNLSLNACTLQQFPGRPATFHGAVTTQTGQCVQWDRKQRCREQRTHRHQRSRGYSPGSGELAALNLKGGRQPPLTAPSDLIQKVGTPQGGGGKEGRYEEAVQSLRRGGGKGKGRRTGNEPVEPVTHSSLSNLGSLKTQPQISWVAPGGQSQNLGIRAPQSPRPCFAKEKHRLLYINKAFLITFP